MFKKILPLFLILSLGVQAQSTSTGVDTIIVGKPGSSGPVKIKSKDGGYLKKEVGGPWLYSPDGLLEKKLGSGSGSGGSSGINLLANDSLEDGLTPGWTSSGGTFSQQTYTNGVEGDLKYARFVASTSGQYVETTAVAIPTSFSGGCQADFKKVNVATASQFKIQAMDTTAAIVYAEQTIGISSWIKVPTISFPCPVAGTMVKLRLISLAAGTIDFDKGYFGSNQNLVSIAQARLVGEATYSATGTPFTTTSSTFVTAMQASQSVTYSGNLSAPITTNAFGFSMATMPAGDYIIRASGFNGGDGGGVNNAIPIISFGSSHIATGTICGRSSTTGAAAGASSSSASSDFTCSFSTGVTLSAKEFYLKLKTGAGGTVNLAPDVGGKISVYFFPSSSEVAVSNEQSSWFIDANIGGGNLDLGTAAQASYTSTGHATLDLVVNTNKGSANAEIPCASGVASTGLTCTGASEVLGIVFTPLAAGPIEACFDFGVSTTDVNGTTFQLVETSNTGSAIIQEGGSRMTSWGTSIGSQLHICGSFNFSDTSKRTLKIMYEKTATSGAPMINADRLATLGQRDIYVTVKPLLSAFNRPVLTGDQVTTPGGKKNIHAKARVSASGVVTYLGSDTPWISSNQCTITSTSLFSCNYVAGIFDGVNIPICHASVSSSAGTGTELRNELVSSLTIETFTTSSGAAVARGFNISCDGISPN